MVLFEDGLVLYLPFSEGAPDVVSPSKTFDKSKRQNHGTINGAVFVKPYEDDEEDEGDNPLVIYDDDETFWTGEIQGIGSVDAPTLSEETSIVQKGSSSLKAVVGAGAGSLWLVSHNYGADQDWSQYDFISFWWYGSNSGNDFLIQIRSVDATWGHFFECTIIDDFTGWQRIIVPLERFIVGGGTPSWSSVSHIRFKSGAANWSPTFYLDRVILDVGNWRFGEALDFDGVDDYVDCGNDPSLNMTTAITVMCWVKSDVEWDDQQAWCGIIAKGRSPEGWFIIAKSGTKKIRTSVYIGTSEKFVDSPDLDKDVWYHVAMTFDGTWITLYINGQYAGATSASGSIDLTSDILEIGQWDGLEFDGQIDEVRIYNRALNPAEIRTLYLEKAFDLKRGLVLHLPFSEGAEDVVSPSTTRDQSRQQNHGTLNGPVFIKPYEDDEEDEGDNPLVVYDDDETVWVVESWGAGTVGVPVLSEETTEVKKGSSSLKIVVGAGVKSDWLIKYVFGANQDWSQKDFISLWWYGVNSGKTFRILFDAPDTSNRFYLDQTEDWSGWKRIIIPLERFLIFAGNPDWATVGRISVQMFSNASGTWYLDRTIVDVGNWRFGEALDFDGTNDKVTVPHSESFNFERTDSFSISLWVKIHTMTSGKVIFAKSSAADNKQYMLIIYDGSGKCGFYMVSAWAGNTIRVRTPNNALSTTNFRHIVITYDGSSSASGIKIYVDGVSQDLGVDADALTGSIQTTYPLYLGVNATANWSNSQIDEFRIYNRELSSAEVRALYAMKARG